MTGGLILPWTNSGIVGVFGSLVSMFAPFLNSPLEKLVLHHLDVGRLAGLQDGLLVVLELGERTHARGRPLPKLKVRLAFVAEQPRVLPFRLLRHGAELVGERAALHHDLRGRSLLRRGDR